MKVLLLIGLFKTSVTDVLGQLAGVELSVMDVEKATLGIKNLASEPQVVVVPISSKQQPLEQVQWLLDNGNSTPVIVVSEPIDSRTQQKMLASGIRGIVPACADAKTLEQAITVVASGNMWLHTEHHETCEHSLQLEALTPAELTVLRLVAEGFSNKEIASKINKSAGTVRNTVSTILLKLDARDRTQAAVWAVKRGLV